MTSRQYTRIFPRSSLYNKTYTHLTINSNKNKNGIKNAVLNYLSPKRLLNLSTRPPVSTSFCLPVKKGWHFEQMSTFISPAVDLVSNVFPHAHLTVAVLYSGCIPFFTKITSFNHIATKILTYCYIKIKLFLKILR